MSWYAYVTIDTGGEGRAVVEEIGNCTYNLAPMFDKAFNFDYGEYPGLRGLHELGAHGAILILKNAVAKMKANSGEYRKLNPPNGWGNYEIALEYLEAILAACVEHPKGTIEIS